MLLGEASLTEAMAVLERIAALYVPMFFKDNIEKGKEDCPDSPDISFLKGDLLLKVMACPWLH